jgi:hypothetical protein
LYKHFNNAMTRGNTKKKFSLLNSLSKCLSRLVLKSVWRNGSMTTTRSPLTLLAEHVAQLSRRMEGVLALERFAGTGLDVAGAGDLTALVGQCVPPGGRLRRAEVLHTLLPLARHDEVASVCVVVTLRPELNRMARLLARVPLDHEEAESEMVAIAWDVVTKPCCSSRPRGCSPESLVDAIWTEVRRTAGMRRRSLIEIIPLAEDFDVPAPVVDPLERWPGLLAAAVAAGVLTPRQVVVIAQSRMDQRPLTEIATALGRPYDAVNKERQRAESALREFALAYVWAEVP